MIIKQSEITQLNKDGARLVAEVATSSKRTRDLEVQADQVRADLNQARVDQARMEAERDALRFMGQQQADEVATERAERARLAGELIKVTAQLDAQQQLLVEYRTKLGVAGPAG
ncbi:integrase [Ralstonia solanacearum]|nr:integrase [Ralstonia solanacearum]